jgi:hypothetical protein
VALGKPEEIDHQSKGDYTEGYQHIGYPLQLDKQVSGDIDCQQNKQQHKDDILAFSMYFNLHYFSVISLSIGKDNNFTPKTPHLLTKNFFFTKIGQKGRHSFCPVFHHFPGKTEKGDGSFFPILGGWGSFGAFSLRLN